MFEESMIVQSAVSAFNNAALIGPAFLWSALLTLPLYWLVWKFGDKIAEYLHWSNGNITNGVSLWLIVITVAWIVLFGGSYSVLRDDASTLPFMIASIVFVSFLFIGAHTRDIKYFKRENIIYIVLVMLSLGVSDMHTWWGPLLQSGAGFFGFIIGRYLKMKISAIPATLLIGVASVVAILMQPEYFRFGQLGNLTWIHLLFVIIFGVLAAATMAVRHVNTAGRIHNSAYIKLKWMTRFIVALGIALFVMTESVPVFLGLCVATYVSFALTIWHAKKIPSAFDRHLFALSMMVFGIIATMPAIVALAIVYMTNTVRVDLWREIRRML